MTRCCKSFLFQVDLSLYYAHNRNSNEYRYFEKKFENFHIVHVRNKLNIADI